MLLFATVAAPDCSGSPEAAKAIFPGMAKRPEEAIAGTVEKSFCNEGYSEKPDWAQKL